MKPDKRVTTYEVRISGLTELQARILARIRRSGGVTTEIWVDVPSGGPTYSGALFTRVFDSSDPALVDVRFKDWW